jgi:hypothetical protein
MPWVNEGPTAQRPEGPPESLATFQAASGRWAFLPRASASGLSPGLESGGPLGHEERYAKRSILPWRATSGHTDRRGRAHSRSLSGSGTGRSGRPDNRSLFGPGTDRSGQTRSRSLAGPGTGRLDPRHIRCLRFPRLRPGSGSGRLGQRYSHSCSMRRGGSRAGRTGSERPTPPHGEAGGRNWRETAPGWPYSRARRPGEV